LDLAQTIAFGSGLRNSATIARVNARAIAFSTSVSLCASPFTDVASLAVARTA
jgi:hypothetical protein